MPLQFWFIAVPLLLIFVPAIFTIRHDRVNKGSKRYIMFVGLMAMFSMAAGMLGAAAILIVDSVYGEARGAIYLVYIPAVTFAVSASTLLLLTFKHNAAVRRRMKMPAGVKVPVAAVVGVMALLLAVDTGLTWLLATLNVNVFLAHIQIAGSSAVLAGASTIFGARRFPFFAASIGTGLLFSFLLILLLPVEPAIVKDPASPAAQISQGLVFGALLYGASYALCKQVIVGRDDHLN